jgi:hypothetical protein
MVTFFMINVGYNLKFYFFCKTIKIYKILLIKIVNKKILNKSVHKYMLLFIKDDFSMTDFKITK